MQCQVGIQIVVIDECVQDSYMFVNSDDIVLFKVVFILLIVEVKDYGDNFKGLIKKYIICGGKQQ